MFSVSKKNVRFCNDLTFSIFEPSLTYEEMIVLLSAKTSFMKCFEPIKDLVI
jgi:hypothetical protein